MVDPGSHRFVTHASRTAYEGAILALRIDEVEMPGGDVARREVVEHDGAVAVVARDDDGRIAMVRQYRHPVGRRLLELPAGLLDGGPGESPLDAARRELAEETDLAAERWRVLVDLVSSPGFTDESVRVFLAEELSVIAPAGRIDEEADMTVEWLALDEAVAMVMRGEIVNATAVAGLLATLAADRSGEAPRAVDAPWRDRPTARSTRLRE
ncbi:NUDIX domain-containing protein [Gordonia shandongensis]|uniref:NUDIX domain-containing protein n=1 Tax=Gordonia shandongensis TaxID=376351 RepID=UPI0004082E73|nr:NUDIX hydrolase [Gordonia shandongensis]